MRALGAEHGLLRLNAACDSIPAVYSYISFFKLDAGKKKKGILISRGFENTNKQKTNNSRMADPSWSSFVDTMTYFSGSCEVISSCCGPQRKHFWTLIYSFYYFKFRSYSLNALRGNEGERHFLPLPGLRTGLKSSKRA